MIESMILALMGLPVGIYVPTGNLDGSSRVNLLVSGDSSQVSKQFITQGEFTPPKSGKPDRREGGGTR